jgi:hypothetical protein
MDEVTGDRVNLRVIVSGGYATHPPAVSFAA